MELALTYNYRGWRIRYNVLEGFGTGSTIPSKHIKQVVFVHGAPWSSIVYESIIKALLAREPYQILAYDLPGYGRSQVYEPVATEAVSNQGFSGDTSVKFQGEVLAALLKHTKFDGRESSRAPAVIAHDIAGAIVLRAHLIHGCDFDSMVLLDTNAILPWGDGFYKLARSEPEAFLKLPPNIFEAVVLAVTRSACHDPKVLQSGWEDALTRPWISDSSDQSDAPDKQKSFIRQIAQANDGDVAEMLEHDLYKNVRCDVKIIWGEQDQWIPKNKIEKLVKMLNEKVKECVYIPDAGHLVMLDQPARVAVEVFSWLNRRNGI